MNFKNYTAFVNQTLNKNFMSQKAIFNDSTPDYSCVFLINYYFLLFFVFIASTSNLDGQTNISSIPHVRNTNNFYQEHHRRECKTEIEYSEHETRHNNDILPFNSCSPDCSSQNTGNVLDIEDLLINAESINNDPYEKEM